jgi:16S rRNA (uracil1498-N3)-methyltransferase
VIRLFVSDDLTPGATVSLTVEQTHYLANVMRLGVGDPLRLFNGRDGEWTARLAAVGRREARLSVDTLARPQALGPDLDLIVALVKRARLEVIAEKAAELGARRLRLVTTERTNAAHANVARLAAIATEAAEQTGRLDVPEVVEAVKLDALLAGWSGARRLMFCDEAGDARPVAEALAGRPGQAWAILIGPEGGFSPAERARIRALPDTVPVSLGPRILRADTAAIAAVSLWQASLGDWRGT